MPPAPQEHSMARHDILTPQLLDDNRIVISGMSGLYPQSRNIKEFADVLYNKVNPVTQQSLRFQYDHPEVVQHTGSIPEIECFDAQFFKVNYRLASIMDPMGKKVLEQSYQAVYDAGVNPEDLSGKKVGVYIGSCFSETEKASIYKGSTGSGLGIAGCSKTMFANRISYWLNAKGPSMAIDEACCSATAALEQAYLAMRRGECEAAIVGSGYLCLHPQSSVHYSRIINLCPDGKTKSFDEHADGCAKSEAVNVLFLQNAKDALRVYAEVINVKNEFISMVNGGTGPMYGFYRNLNSTVKFIKKFYEDSKIPPQAIEYVEAFGSALPEADKVELQAIEEIFCQDREDPLLIGSVMSNIGYAEAASGISAVTKVLLGYHKGELAANLHCEHPRQDIAALRDGRMRVITDHQPFHRSYVAVNGMSVTGVNSHVLLHGFYKPKVVNRYKSNIPHLVTISGRHEQAVQDVIDILKSNPIDPEQLALLHNIHRARIPGHLARGFIILDTNAEGETISLSENSEYFDDARRPLWFVYSGMGSQWTGMGSPLLRIPIFAAAIQRCQKVLEPKGLNITNIISSTDKNVFNNVLHSFVGIAAIQIGLTDILRELGLRPSGIIGHSVGELGCAYADGCVTTEEMILSAYYRGLVSLETEFIHGSMAAVGVGYQEMIKICPSEIEVACHNGPASCTLSGPANVMHEFVAELTAKGVFAKEVPCSNIPYHSRYIADAGPGLLKYLKEAIKSPKPRSERWLSSSVPKSRWDEPLAKVCSPEYFTNNLLSPVLFEETSRMIPSDAILVEVAPHGLLQAILKHSMPPTCTNIPLTRRNHPDNALFLLEAIGKLYKEGYNSNLQVLYPKVEMPVSTGTPFLSHLVKWAHGERWSLPLYRSATRISGANCVFIIALQDKEHAYLNGHSIRGRVLYPYAASLTLAWDTLAMIMGIPKKQLSVIFTDVQLHAQPILHQRRQLRLSIAIHRGTGSFEILDGSAKVITGFINPLQAAVIKNNKEQKSNEKVYFTTQDIYQLLRDRDYAYSGEFQSLKSVNESLDEATLVWKNNWATFIDGMLQLNVLRQPHCAVSLPTRIRKIHIDINEHSKCILNSQNTTLMARISEELDKTSCGGVYMENINFENLPPVEGSKLSLHFFYFDDKLRDVEPSFNNGKFLPLKEKATMSENVRLQSTRFGNYDSLNWVDAPELVESGVTVTVHYAAINNNDIKKFTNSLHSKKIIENTYGSDFSGITETGERVMGIVSSGAASSRVCVNSDHLWPVPQHWSLEDAATVPLAYAQAFYCLGIKFKLFRGMTVLVHGGSGALGQALISIALAHDCEVFTTVSDIRKKNFLLKLYPELKADHIGSSRDHTFADMVMMATNQKGCDVIISSLQGYLKTASIKCTGHFGTYYDISQIQNNDKYYFGMYNLFVLKNYATVDFSTLFKDDHKNDIKAINKMISDGISRGYVRPLSRVTYEPHDAARAFHLLALSQHRGRVLLRMRDNMLHAQHRLRCSADRCHLLFCNKATFELQFADRLVTRGVKKLCLHVSTLSSYLQHRIRSWQTSGVQVEVFTEDFNEQNASGILNKASRLGSLEGVYITTNDRNERINEKNISYLELLLRKSWPKLRYFAIFNIGVCSIGKNVCLQRKRDQLPTTMLMLPDLKDDSYTECARWRSAIDAAELALTSTHCVLQAEIECTPRLSLLQEVTSLIVPCVQSTATVMSMTLFDTIRARTAYTTPTNLCPDVLSGINLLDNVKNSHTLKELGVPNHKLQLISNFLKTQYNIAFDEEQVSLLTVSEIVELEKTVIELPYEDIKGLQTFFSYIDSDELLATTDMIFLPTHVNSASLRDDEFVSDQKYICIVPGMEGHNERFRILCERLKLPAFVLQPGLDHPHETARDTAERYTQVLMEKTKLKDSFYILGYETGIFVALEMAAILEGLGLTGTVFCLGLAPDELKNKLETELADFETEEQLRDAVLRHMYTLMTGADITELDNALQGLETWSRKVDTYVRVLLKRASHSAQYARALIEYALARLQQARRSTVPARALRSRLVLLRAVHEPPQHAALQQYSHQPLVVHQLSTQLAHVAIDLRCAAIINQHLDPVILEDFATRNICDTYLVDANSFVTIE